MTNPSETAKPEKSALLATESALLVSDRIRITFLGIMFFAAPFSIALAALGTFGLFFTTLFDLVAKKIKLPNAIINYTLPPLILTALVSIALSADIAENMKGIREYWRVFIPVMVMMALMQHPNILRKLILIMAVSAFFHGIFAVAQYYGGQDFFHPSTALVVNGKTNAIGIFSHHMTLSGVMMLLLPVFLTMVFFKPVPKMSRFLYIASSAVAVAAMIYSMARISWVAALFSVLTLLILFRRKTELFLFFIGVTLLIAFFVYLQSHKNLTQNNYPLQRFATVLDTQNDRIKMLEAAVAVLKEHYLFGLGTETIQPLEDAYANITKNTNHRFYNKPSVGVHNLYAQLTLNYGVFHLIAYLLFLSTFFVAAFSSLRRKSAAEIKETPLLKGLLAAIVGFAVMGVAENNFYDGEVMHLFLTWIGAACFIIHKINTHRKERL